MLVVTFSLIGCDPDGDGHYFEKSTSCSSDPEHVSRLVAKLDELRVKYKWVQNSTCIEYSAEGEIDTLLTELYPSNSEVTPESYPANFAPGRSASWGDKNSDLIKILRESGVEPIEYTYGEMNWIGWSYEEIEKVEELLEYSDELKAMNKETREFYTAFNRPNN